MSPKANKATNAPTLVDSNAVTTSLAALALACEAVIHGACGLVGDALTAASMPLYRVLWGPCTARNEERHKSNGNVGLPALFEYLHASVDPKRARTVTVADGAPVIIVSHTITSPATLVAAMLTGLTLHRFPPKVAERKDKNGTPHSYLRTWGSEASAVKKALGIVVKSASEFDLSGITYNAVAIIKKAEELNGGPLTLPAVAVVTEGKPQVRPLVKYVSKETVTAPGKDGAADTKRPALTTFMPRNVVESVVDEATGETVHASFTLTLAKKTFRMTSAEKAIAEATLPVAPAADADAVQTKAAPVKAAAIPETASI